MQAILGLTFFLSGAAGLIFETLWFRMAGLTFGNSVWATTLVLASFMGGLALGNAIAARFGVRLRRPLQAFSVLELMVGLTGFALVMTFPLLPRLFAPLFAPLLDQPVALNVLRFGMSFSLLLIPTTSMGLTLPLVVKALNRNRPDFGKSLGHLYGWNTLGAMVGAVAGEEVLIGLWGIRGSAAAATALNCSAALLALLASRGLTAVSPAEAERGASRPRTTREQQRILAAAFLSGGIFLALEVVWFRFLSLFVLSTTRSFAFMLLMVLLGIGAGAYLSSQLLRVRPDAYRWCRQLALVAGLLVLWSYVFFADLPLGDPSALSDRALDLLNLSARLMLPVSLVSGFLFTFLGRAFFETWGEETRAVGLTTLANTLGATLGAPVAAFVLLPICGIERSFFALAVLYAVVGLLLPTRSSSREARADRVSFASALALFLGSLALYPFGLMANHFIPIVAGRFARGETAILGYREGRSETLIYTQEYWLGEPYAKRLLTNSYTMSGVDLPPLRYMKYFAYWPLAFHPGVEDALLISYGVGSTAKALTASSEIERIDVVDISREILDSDRVIFPSRADSPLSDPRVTVYVEDGRFYLLTTREKYDLITAEPPPPAVSGVVNLYTLEYFQLLFDRLEEGGYATYWLPLENLAMGDAKSIVHAFCSVFTDCSLWRGAKLEMVLVGSRNASAVRDRSVFERQWRDPGVARELEILGFETPGLLLATFVADSTFLKPWSIERPPLVDDFPHRLSGDPEPPPEVYLRELGHPASRKRYLESGFLKERLPDELFEAGLAAYTYQELIDERLDAYPAEAAVNLEKLHRVLSETELRTPVLWLLGDFTEFSGVIDALQKRRVSNGELELHLGFRALAERDFGLAAERFERARVLGAGPRADYFRVLALAYAGDQEKAERLSARMRRDGGDANRAQFWEFCSRTLGLQLDPSPISNQ